MKWLLIAALSVSPAFAETDETPAPSEPRPIVSEIVSSQSMGLETFIGTVAAKNESDLGFPFNGTISSRLVDVGDVVKAGDVLAVLDSVALEAAKNSAEAAERIATTQFGSASRARERAQTLVERGVDTKTDIQDSERAFVAAQANKEQAQANLERARYAFSLAVLKAPVDGVVTEVFADTGSAINSGGSVLRLAATGDREVIADLSDQNLSEISVGDLFNVTLTIDPKIKTTAKVARIEPVAEKNTRLRRAHFTLLDTPLSFRFGALVEIQRDESLTQNISIPYSSVLSPDTDPRVWVVDRSHNKVSQKSIVLGNRQKDRVFVSSGLEIGDEIVLKGIHSLVDGETVGQSIAK